MQEEKDEEKEIILLTDKEIKFYEEQKVCRICKGKFCYDKNKKSQYDLHHKVEIIVITQENLLGLLIMFAI